MWYCDLPGWTTSYTFRRWHWTRDGKVTLCGIRPPEGADRFQFLFPWLVEGLGEISCCTCLKRMTEADHAAEDKREGVIIA